MNIFFRNWDLKILAVIAALLLWIFVVVVQNSIYVFPDALEVKALNLDQNLSVQEPLPQVKIRVKTDQKNLNSLKLNDFDAYVDVSNLGVGKYTLKVNVNGKNAHATVVSIEPAEVELNLEAITTKEIPLESEVVGKPAQGFLVEETKLDLQKVTVKGPASLLKDIHKAKATIVLSGNENITFIRSVTPEILADIFQKNNVENPNNIKFEPQEIQARIKIVPEPTTVNTATPPIETNTTQPGATQTNNVAKKSVMADIIFDKESFKAAVKETLPRNILVTVEGSAEILKNVDNKSIKVKLREANVETGGIYNVKNEDIILSDPQLKIIEFNPSKIQIKF